MSLELSARTHQQAYLSDAAQTVYALVELMPDAQTARLPVDLRLVLDVSGSMGSPAAKTGKTTKLGLTRDAAIAMLDHLAPGDHLVVLSFDDAASELYAGTIHGPGDLVKAKKALAGLRVGGGTSILAGLEAAVAEPPLPDHVARLVLVTDGEGGKQEEPDCERLAFDARGQATWLVYGIGVDYNDNFLERLAGANGGRYVHLSDLRQAADAFAAEATAMAEVALASLVVTLEPAAGCELVRVDRIVPQTQPLPVHMPNFFSADLGDVDKARGQKLLVQLGVGAMGAGTHELARLRAGFHVPALKLLNQQRELVLAASFTADASALGTDAEVLRTAQLAGASRLYTLGLAEAADGRGDAAVRTLGSAAGVYEHLGLVDMGDQLRTLTSQLGQGDAMDEEVKRTLTTMTRQAWQTGGGGHDELS